MSVEIRKEMRRIAIEDFFFLRANVFLDYTL